MERRYGIPIININELFGSVIINTRAKSAIYRIYMSMR
jgi:hypothetical protein